MADEALTAVWKSLTAEQARTGHTAVIHSDALGAQLLLFGGLAPTAENAAEVSSCNLSRKGDASEWDTLVCHGQHFTPRSWHTATPLSDGRIIVFGGSDGKRLFGDVLSLSIDAEGATASWSKLDVRCCHWNARTQKL